MLVRLVLTSVAAAALLGACRTDAFAPERFQVSAVITTQPASDTTHCEVTWQTRVNNNDVIYYFSVVFSADTGVAPDTGLAFVADSALANGTASVQTNFPSRNLLVGSLFVWDTLSRLDTTRIQGCVVQ